MKKIITILALLAGYFCSAQSIGYIRYDTTVLQKVGGNNELKILNATRGVTGGVLTNMGNGRTAFVALASSSRFGVSGEDATATQVRNFDINGNIFSISNGVNEIIRFGPAGGNYIYITAPGTYLANGAFSFGSAGGLGDKGVMEITGTGGYDLNLSAENTPGTDWSLIYPTISYNPGSPGILATRVNQIVADNSGTINIGQISTIDTTYKPLVISGTAIRYFNSWAQTGLGSQGLQSVITNDPNITANVTISDATPFTHDFNITSFNGIGFNSERFSVETYDSLEFISPVYKFGGLPPSHGAADSMVVINTATSKLGYRPIPSGSGLTVGTTLITSGTVGRMLFEGSGNVLQQDAGITFDPTANLLSITGPASSLTNGPKSRFFFDSDANPALDYLMYAHDNLNMAWDSYFNGTNWIASHTSAFMVTKNADRFFITGNSSLTVGASFTPTERFGMTAAGIVKMSAYGAGTATFDASGNISSVSDERLKYIQGIVGAGLKEIKKIVPVRYKWRPESGMETSHTYSGFSAQNIQSVLGSEATGINERGQLSIQDRAIMAAMVNAIKELSAKVDYLEAELKKKK